MAFAWLQRKVVWILPGLVLGLALGLTRIAQGGHFMSDVLLPLFVVLFIAHLLGLYILGWSASKRL